MLLGLAWAKPTLICKARQLILSLIFPSLPQNIFLTLTNSFICLNTWFIFSPILYLLTLVLFASTFVSLTPTVRHRRSLTLEMLVLCVCPLTLPLDALYPPLLTPSGSVNVSDKPIRGKFPCIPVR